MRDTLRRLIPAGIDPLLGIGPNTSWSAKEDAWAEMYERLGFPVHSPFRWDNITHHRHLCLDQAISMLLPQPVREALHRNFSITNSGLPRRLQEATVAANNRRFGTSPAGRHFALTRDLVFSPVAPALIEAAHADGWLYRSPNHTPLEDEYDNQYGNLNLSALHRLVSKSIAEGHGLTAHDSNSETGSERGSRSHEPSLVHPNPGATTLPDDGNDEDEEDNDVHPQTYHCELCQIIRKVNIRLARMRVNVVDGIKAVHELIAELDNLRKDFEEEWEHIVSRELIRNERGYHPIPYFFWLLPRYEYRPNVELHMLDLDLVSFLEFLEGCHMRREDVYDDGTEYGGHSSSESEEDYEEDDEEDDDDDDDDDDDNDDDEDHDHDTSNIENVPPVEEPESQTDEEEDTESTLPQAPPAPPGKRPLTINGEPLINFR